MTLNYEAWKSKGATEPRTFEALEFLYARIEVLERVRVIAQEIAGEQWLQLHDSPGAQLLDHKLVCALAACVTRGGKG